jgi:hypothetical protein
MSVKVERLDVIAPRSEKNNTREATNDVRRHRRNQAEGSERNDGHAASTRSHGQCSERTVVRRIVVVRGDLDAIARRGSSTRRQRQPQP